MQRLLLVLFAVLAIAALAITPINAGLDMRQFSCDLGGVGDWAQTVLNLRHLLAYGALAALGFVAMRDRPVWVPLFVLLAITAGVELTQAVFDDGHCRLRDMIPNVIAIALGWGIVLRGRKA
jgi:hypothetical protein